MSLKLASDAIGSPASPRGCFVLWLVPKLCAEGIAAFLEACFVPKVQNSFITQKQKPEPPILSFEREVPLDLLDVPFGIAGVSPAAVCL